MAICSHLAPNGEKSELYQQLEERYGPERAHDIWSEVRSQQFLNKYGDWTKTMIVGQRDINGDLTLEYVAKKLNLEAPKPTINFQEDQSTGYKLRTQKNALADATIALAIDFSSAGEKLTKSSVIGQGKKYIPLDASSFALLMKPKSIKAIIEHLNEVNAKSLNIAGNGIYTMKGFHSQEEVDTGTYKLLKAVTEHPDLKNKIEEFRTGGQTGFDEAGAKAGLKLGIPTTVLAPKKWKFRNIEGKDISNEQQFKERFNDNGTVKPQETKIISFDPGPTDKAKGITTRDSQEIVTAKIKAVYDEAVANPGQQYQFDYDTNTKRYRSGYTPQEMSVMLDSFPIPPNVLLTQGMRSLIQNSSKRILAAFGDQKPSELMNRNEELISSLASHILIPKYSIAGQPDGFFSPEQQQEVVDSIVKFTQQLLANDPSLGYNALVKAIYVMQQKGIQLSESGQNFELAQNLNSIYASRMQFGDMALRKMEKLGVSLNESSRHSVLENLRRFDRLDEQDKKIVVKEEPEVPYQTEEQNGDFIEASSKGLRDWNDVSFEIDPKDTASARVKMFMAMQTDMDRGSYIARESGDHINASRIPQPLGKTPELGLNRWKLEDPKAAQAFVKEWNRKPFWIDGLDQKSNDAVTKWMSDNYPRVAKENFLGMQRLVDYEATFQEALELLGDRPQDVDTNGILKLLSSSNNPVLEQLSIELGKQDQGMQNEFRKVMMKQYQSFTMLLHNRTSDGDRDSYQFQVLDANRYNQKTTLIKHWQEAQKVADIMIQSPSGERVMDLKRIQDRWLPILTTGQSIRDWSKTENQDWAKKAMGNVLRVSGIDMAPEMLSDLFKNTEYWTRNTRFAGGIQRQFSVTKDGKPDGMFSSFILKAAGRDLTEDVSETEALKMSQLNNPLHTDSQLMKILANVAAKYIPVLHSSNHRSSEGKTIWDWGYNTKLSHAFRDFTTNFERAKAKFDQVHIARRSWLLKAINDTPAHLGFMELSYLDGMKPTWGNYGTTRPDMSDREQMLMSMAMFQNNGNGFNKVSKVHYLSLTHSDKTTTPVFRNMPRVDVHSPNLTEGIDSVFYNLFRSEYDRIVSQEKQDSSNPQYEKGKKLFYFMPEFNREGMQKMVEDGLITAKEMQLIYPAGSKLTKSISSDRELPVLQKVFRNIVDRLTTETYEAWRDNGLVLTDEKGDLFDKAYVKKVLWMNGIRKSGNSYVDKEKKIIDQRTVDQVVRQYAVKDYAINNFLFNTATSQLFYGDPAQAYKGKGVSELGDVDTTMKEYAKRLAKDIAPGEDLSWGENKKYNAITLADVKPFEKYLYEVSESLYDKYSEVEGTDAQEVTTVQEHLDVMYAAGKIADKTYNEMSKIVSAAGPGGYYEFTVPEHLAVVLQPAKPVYSGTQVPIDGALLDDYIKSSSYSLYPPLTKGFEIDKLRQHMEANDIQRANFKSAKKLGSPAEPLEAFSVDGTFKEPTPEQVVASRQQLSRDGFRIQQEVPYDEDKTSIKTISQMNKLIDEGIGSMDGFKLNGKEASGVEVQRFREKVRKDLIESNLQEFNKKMGVEDNVADKQKIYNILTDEARKKGYSFNELQGLLARDESGELHIPLWLNTGADRFESLLMSIVNRISDVRMPGKSYVQASSVGYKVKDTGDVHDTPGIVRLTGWDGSALKTLRKENGEVKPAQVIMPFNFFDNEGNRLKLADFLVQPGEEGYEPGVKKIDHTRLPQELLQMIGARIPNQGHSSMLPIEVVGFTPENMGDLVLVPSAITKQMGADFDVDKLYTYRQATNYDSDTKTLSRATEGVDGLKNSYFDVHQSVLTHPGMIEKVLRPLDKPDLGEEADKLGSSAKGVNYYSAMSQLDDFQRGKVAKALVGTSSLAVTFNSVIQEKSLYFGKLEFSQGPDGEPVVSKVPDHITLLDEFTGKPIDLVNLSGNGKSQYSTKDGDISGAEERSKQDNHTSIQSAAVDNAKDRKLDNLNLNLETFPAAQALIQLETADGTSVSLKYVTRLMTQPVIKEYAAEMRKGNDSLSREFDKNLKDTVIARLFDKYREGLTGDEPFPLLSPQSMLKALNTTDTDTKEFRLSQMAALTTFKNLDAIGGRMRELQSLFNQDVNGAGPNLFTALDKVEKLGNLEQVPIFNAEDIYVHSDGTTTEQGEIFDSVNNAALETVTQVLPYHNIQTQVDQIRQITNKTSLTIDQQRDILRAIRSHIYASGQHWWDSAQGDRARLMYTNGDNLSLARRVMEAKNSWGKDNYFLSRLDARIGDNIAAPDFVEYQAATTGTIDEQNNDRGWLDLLMNKDADKRALGEDLLRYAFLTGGRQDANSFVKYVPVSYIAGTEFGKMLQAQDKVLQESRAWEAPGFGIQYLQHNPQMAVQVTPDHFGKLSEGREYPESFQVPDMESPSFKDFKSLVTEDGTLAPVVSYRSTTEGKWLLFARTQVGDTPYYARIDTLGNQFTDEYTPIETGVRSIFPENRSLAFSIPVLSTQYLPDFKSDRENGFGNYDKGISHYEQIGVKPGGDEALQAAFESIARNQSLPQHIRTLAELFSSTPLRAEAAKGADELLYSEPKNHIVLDSELQHMGSANMAGRIALNPDKTSGIREASRTFMHEAIHNRLQTMLLLSGHDTDTPSFYNKKAFQEKYPEAMQHINELERIRYEAFNKLRNYLGEEKLKELQDDLTNGKLLDTDHALVYHLSNIQELVTGVMTNDIVARYLNDIKSEKGVSLIEKIWDTLTKMVKSISKGLGLVVKNDSLLYDAIYHTLKLSTLDADNNNIDITAGIVNKESIIVETEAKANELKSLVENVYNNKVDISNNITHWSLRFSGLSVGQSPIKSKMVAKLSEQLTLIGNSISTARTPEERAGLGIKYRELREDIQELQAKGNLDKINEIGQKQMEWVDRVMANPNPSALDTNLAIATASIWSNLINILYGDAKKISGTNEGFAKLQEDAMVKRIGLLNDKARTVVADALSGRIKLTERDFTSNLADMNLLESNVLTLARAKSLLVQGTAVLGRQEANNRDTERFRTVSKLEELEKKRRTLGADANLLIHVDKESGAWGLTKRYSSEYFSTERKLVSNRDAALDAIAKSSTLDDTQKATKRSETWQRYWKETAKVSTFIDVRKLFDFKTGDELPGSEEYIKELAEKAGGEKYARELVAQAKEKYHEYISTRESTKAFIDGDTQLTDAEKAGKDQAQQDEALKIKKANELEKWLQYNSPGEFLNNMTRDKVGFSRGDNWVVSIPNSANPKFFNENFQKIQGNPKLKELYDHYSTLLQEMIGYLPMDVQQGLPEDFFPIVPKDTVLSLASVIGTIRNWDEKVLEALTATDEEEAARLRPDQIPVMYTNETPRTMDPANRSTDLTKTLEMFSMMALHHKYMNKILNEINVAEQVLKEAHRARGNGEQAGPVLTNTLKSLKYFKDALIYRKPKELQGKVDNPVYPVNPIFNDNGTITDKVVAPDYSLNPASQMKVKADIKKLYEMKLDLTNQVEEKMIEGDYDTEELDNKLARINEKLGEVEYLGRNLYGSKAADVLIGINQLKAIGFQPFSAVTNLTFAHISLFTHAAGNIDFGLTEARQAWSTMLHASKSYYSFGQASDPVAEKIRNLMGNFGVMGDIVDTQYGRNDLTKRTSGAKANALHPYNWQMSGDYFTKGAMMVAMMKKQKVEVTDQSTGEKKTIPLWDAFDKDGKWNTEKFGENKMWYSENVSEQVDNNKFRDRLRKTSTLIYGNQDKNAPLMARKEWLWRLAGQFRISWLPEGFMARFSDERFDSDLGRTVKGRYRTMGDIGILTSGLLMAKQLMASLPGVKTDPFEGVTDKKGNPLTDIDMENMRKNFVGIAITAALTATMIGLQSLGDNRSGKKRDDDDRQRTLLINMLTRNYQDMMQYASPAVFDTVTGNLMPAFSVITDFTKAMKATGRYMFKDNSHDKHAFEHWISKVTHAIPVANLYNKSKYMLNRDLNDLVR